MPSRSLKPLFSGFYNSPIIGAIFEPLSQHACGLTTSNDIELAHRRLFGAPMDAEIQFLRLPKVLKRLGISRSTLYARLNPNSRYFDSTFPKPIKLFPDLKRSSVVWILHEIIEWQKKQADKR